MYRQANFASTLTRTHPLVLKALSSFKGNMEEDDDFKCLQTIDIRFDYAGVADFGYLKELERYCSAEVLGHRQRECQNILARKGFAKVKVNLSYVVDDSLYKSYSSRAPREWCLEERKE